VKSHELQPSPGSHRQRKRIGRGISAGQGKTSGRGQKGQGSRSSVNIPTSFEGGQMPLAQRLPKLRGFTNINRREFAVVNLGKLNRFEAGTAVNPELLKEVGLVRKRFGGVKILAAGELKVALKVSAHRISAGAQAQIEKAGGSIELIGPQTADKTPRRHKKKAAKAEIEEPPARKADKGVSAEGGAKAVDADAAAEISETADEEETGAVGEAGAVGKAEPGLDGGEPEPSPEE
jgi:large subunit ribosomal protein L15